MDKVTDLLMKHKASLFVCYRISTCPGESCRHLWYERHPIRKHPINTLGKTTDSDDLHAISLHLFRMILEYIWSIYFCSGLESSKYDIERQKAEVNKCVLIFIVPLKSRTILFILEYPVTQQKVLYGRHTFIPRKRHHEMHVHIQYDHKFTTHTNKRRNKHSPGNCCLFDDQTMANTQAIRFNAITFHYMRYLEASIPHNLPYVHLNIGIMWLKTHRVKSSFRWYVRS